MKKKILWLCIFSNATKKSHMSLWVRRKTEYGAWIPNLLQGFVGDPNYEIHVVSTENWMRKTYESWSADGINYHCYQTGLPIFGRGFSLPIDALTRYWLNRHRIKRIIDQVQPDVIHLVGAEMPHYGSVLLDLKKAYPTLVTIQGFIHRAISRKDSFSLRSRCKYEERILKQCVHYTGDYEAESVLRRINPEIQSFKPTYFPVNEALVARTSPQEIKYDVLFAGKLTREKGFGDFLELVRLLKAERPHIRAAVVGYADVYAEAVPFIEKHGLQENVVWLGRFPSQEGLFQAYRQAKLFVAPTYNDCFASTLRENMLLGTTCVAYRTGGIPFANRDGAENIVLVDQGDVKGLFERVLRLLKNDAERAEVSARALAFARREFSLKANVEVIRKQYERVMRV
jgi:glycosyltransferase involved in cell wall biosynthesis